MGIAETANALQPLPFSTSVPIYRHPKHLRRTLATKHFGKTLVET
jgi:hypothetical protein